ncbi:hypothetical protein RDWZM_007053 [Blomia tropicalis]|uniref:FHF complex subunit HOOK-interacting protein C-terminal domain-containing protein n=1 Tax=Blomia tropicalis TaxID=40697 RepID=A0A9Q0RNZ8_BLOTA|nr:hypothetical protein BLOT_015549 [Blomia tropicalis]KAJ6221241.1 hypothetical protein RDWZM_007053 [Blomia tropicalis]
MFNLISNSPLSDVLAPKLSPLEELIVQWESFTSFFNSDQHPEQELCKCRIESTNLSNKLSIMCDILVQEQAKHVRGKVDRTAAGICASLEYALQNKIFDTLSVLALADAPLGISPRIMLFFNRILFDCKVQLIPHRTVHSALEKLILICGKIPAGPYEPVEMLFLGCITDLIYRNPPFLNFFLSDSYPLLNSLLSLLCSPDSEIAKRAGDSIIKLLCVENENADRLIIERTPFCSKIINQIIVHYGEIPRSLNAQELETAIYMFRNDSISSPDSSFSNSVRKFLCFLKWYILFDMIMYHIPQTSNLKETMLKHFKMDFLQSIILPDLIGDGFASEFDAVDNVFLTTILLSNCLRNTESFILFNCIGEFLTIPDPQDPIIRDKHHNHRLMSTLLKRCCLTEPTVSDDPNMPNESQRFKLASVTIQLFEDIISRPSRKLVNKLIVDHLRSRHYIDLESQNNNDETIDRYETIFDKLNPDSIAELSVIQDEIRKLPNMLQQTIVPIESNKLNSILHYFTSLIPAEFKFQVDQEPNDYAGYVKEAIKGEQLFLTNCFIHWQHNETLDHVTNSSNNEGDFLRMIFDNLNAMLSLPYDINLQVFSLVAKISLIPDDYINEYLLDPTISLNATSRSLFTILHKLVEELQISVKGIDDLRTRLLFTKQRLLHNNTEHDNGLRISNPMDNILQCLIVLDEFCKELACIIYSKNQIHVHQQSDTVSQPSTMTEV